MEFMQFFVNQVIFMTAERSDNCEYCLLNYPNKSKPFRQINANMDTDCDKSLSNFWWTKFPDISKRGARAREWKAE